MQEKIKLKTTSTERCKKNSNERQPSMQDKLKWKTISKGRRHSIRLEDTQLD